MWMWGRRFKKGLNDSSQKSSAVMSPNYSLCAVVMRLTKLCAAAPCCRKRFWLKPCKGSQRSEANQWVSYSSRQQVVSSTSAARQQHVSSSEDHPTQHDNKHWLFFYRHPSSVKLNSLSNASSYNIRAHFYFCITFITQTIVHIRFFVYF